MKPVLTAITRERAIIFGLALAVLQAAANGEITRETAVPVIAGIALRFFVTPAGPGARPLPATDEAQAAAAENTDSAPRTVAEAAVTATLPQEPDSEID